MARNQTKWPTNLNDSQVAGPLTRASNNACTITDYIYIRAKNVSW